MYPFLLRLASRLFLWSIVRSLSRRHPEWDRGAIERIADRELTAIPVSLVAHFEYQTSEATILDERLSRRYDPGLALNEAANRAIAAKKAAREPNPDNLTARQKLALEFQKESLARMVRKA